MRLPDSLPPLAEPSFVLANPPVVQYAVLALALLLPLAVWGWLFALREAWSLDAGRIALALAMAGLFAAGARPRHWRAWVIFAADRKGIYLGTRRHDFIHVPWRDVGASSIGVAGRGGNRQRTVILQIRVAPADWQRLLGGGQRRAWSTPDERGFLPFGIGSALRAPEATLAQIERVRREAGPQ